MSYASGIMMGMAVGDGLRRLFLGKGASKPVSCPAPEPGLLAFFLARAIPGRRRYYARAILGNEPLARALEETLSRLPGIDEVRANPVSGSLLLLYHGDEAAVDAITGRLEERVFRNPGAPTPLEELGSGLEHGLGRVGRHLRGTFLDLSGHLKAVTGGWFDLPSLLSLAFVIRGLQKILQTQQLPSGPQLIWWAFSLLRGWRTE